MTESQLKKMGFVKTKFMGEAVRFKKIGENLFLSYKHKKYFLENAFGELQLNKQTFLKLYKKLE